MGLIKGKATLFIDQYGDKYWAKSIKQLKEQIRGRVEKMYADKKDGSIVHVGYVIGEHWLRAYQPIEQYAGSNNIIKER